MYKEKDIIHNKIIDLCYRYKCPLLSLYHVSEFDYSFLCTLKHAILKFFFFFLVHLNIRCSSQHLPMFVFYVNSMYQQIDFTTLYKLELSKT